jgi:hypothetical protein
MVMASGLNVLVLESDPGASAAARHELSEAGHTIHYCHDPGEASFPCNALRDGRGCPFEEKPMDVVLDVRRRARTTPTVREDGVACAIRQHVPLVVAGPTVFSPYADYATELCHDTVGVVAACEGAAAAPLARHTTAAQDALDATLARRSLPADASVTVFRRKGSLDVVVKPGSEIDRATKNMIAVRITAALRAIDHHASGIDVVFN